MKKFKRFNEGGPTDEATAKQSGLDVSSKEKPMGFFERLRAGNIDDPSSEAYKRFGAGRGRTATPAAPMAESKPQIVPRIPPAPRMPSPNEESGKMQNLISAGSDFSSRNQDEGYRPNAGTAMERAMLEGAFDSDKITENTGPRTKPIVTTPVKPVASKPKVVAPKVTDTGDESARLLKKYKKVFKNAKFHADFKTVEKVAKKYTNKYINKNVTEICTFSTFTHVHQIGLLITFFGCIFLKLFLRI
jgi:hypothetical protein